ncbi:MAG: hypothetical protein JO023_12290 [Chloroflexi bacterium]|nr:hypothetical protein [Chloroflexota bacterium]
MQSRVFQAGLPAHERVEQHRPAYPPLTASALALQQTIGNQAFGRLLRQPGSTPRSVQRLVQWAELEKTKAEGRYGVRHQGATTLVSKSDAPDPKPVGLYTQGTDVTETHVPVKTWTPNVRFMQKTAVAQPRDAPSESGLELGAVGLATWQRDALETIARFEAALRQAMEDSATHGQRPPSMGILGLNDCAAWAHMLRRLIAEEELKFARLAQPEVERPGVPFGLGNAPDTAPAVGVGDTMLQRLFGSGSEYHGATVVATDSKTIVTLEGHVEKNLAVPVFHFYDGGLPGFVDANNEGETYRAANKVGIGTVTRLEAPTKKFYKDLKSTLDYYEQQLATDPQDLDAHVRLLFNFRQLVRTPTTKVKEKGTSNDTCAVQ